MMFLETALSFIWKHWRLFAGGFVVGVLGLLLLIAKGDARHYKALWQQEQAAHQLTAAKLATSNASIDTLTAALNDKNAESVARAQAYADSKASDAKTVAAMDARQRADASRLEALHRLARDLPDQPACRVPAALSAQLEGL